MTPLRAIDLCCGAGGWACASRGLPIEWVAVADLAPDCLETWQLNHGPAHPGCALVRADLSTAGGMQAVLEAAGTVDLIVGGIPCEQVSTARGNRPLKEGELDTLHRLIDQVFRAAATLRPRWWAIEDVEAILEHLPPPLCSPVAYASHKINAAHYGPQRRRRVFFGDYPWPVADPEPGPRTLGEILRPGPYRTLGQLAKYERTRSKWYGKRLRVQEPEDPSDTVLGSVGMSGPSGERGAMIPLARVLDAGQPCPTVADFGSRHERAALVETPSAQARLLATDRPAPTITASYYCDQREVMAEGLVRVMEWQEAALLQGFPADYLFAASWSRTWKLVAQAIPIQVGRAILQAVCQEAAS